MNQANIIDVDHLPIRTIEQLTTLSCLSDWGFVGSIQCASFAIEISCRRKPHVVEIVLRPACCICPGLGSGFQPTSALVDIIAKQVDLWVTELVDATGTRPEPQWEHMVAELIAKEKGAPRL